MESRLRACTLSSAAVMFYLASASAEPTRLTVEGKERSYLLVQPGGHTPRPTIVMLHGLNGSGEDVARSTGLDRLAPQSGWVAAFPDRQSPLQGWNFFPAGKEPPLLIERSRAIGGVPNDVRFIEALVTDLTRRGISDPKRIYLAGFSNGSFMALRMICAHAELFAAVGLLVGGMPELVGKECNPAKPLPAMMLNSTADASVPYAGGVVQPIGLFSAWPTERLAAFFRKLNGCSERYEDSLLLNARPNIVEVTNWTSCVAGPVVLYRVVGGDHGALWNNNIDVGGLLMNFFRDHGVPLHTSAEPAVKYSVKAVFEQYKLLGRFAWDCGKPASGNNLHYVHRLLDSDHVQREQMSASTVRDWFVVLNKATAVNPNELVISGTLTGRIAGRNFEREAADGRWLLESGRLLQWEAAVGGDKTIDAGRQVSNGFQIPWTHRCGD
jgi:polyhydroxybutyrate depolymerase